MNMYTYLQQVSLDWNVSKEPLCSKGKKILNLGLVLCNEEKQIERK
nr:MAG TPA: hypothetical protein [Crassvirales sp.]